MQDTVGPGAAVDHPPAGAGPSGPGYRATVWTLALGQLVNWAVLYYGFSSLVLPMDTSLGWGQPVLMGAFTFGLAVCGVSTYAVGALIDAGHGRAVMTGGVLAAALGVAGWSQVSQPWMLYAVWAVLGAASAATLYDPVFAVLTKRYPTRFRHAITTLTLVGGFASTLSFPAIAGLQSLGLDWRQTLLVLAAALLAMVPLHAWALRGPMLVAGPVHENAQADATVRQALRQASFWLMTGCFTLVAFSQAALWAHVMPAFADKGVAQADTLLVLMAVGPSQVLGRMVFLWVGQHWRWRSLGMFVLGAMPIGLALLALGQSLGVLLLFALVFGLGNGLVTIVRGGLVPLYWGRGQVGRISGLMSGIGLIARASAPILATALLLVLPGYRELLLVLAGLGVLSLLAFWWAGPPGRG